MQAKQQFLISSKTIVSTLESIEISKDRIFSFQEPICGFESIKRYALMPTNGLPSDQGYFMLHSLEGDNISFIIYAVPFNDLTPELQEKLQIFVDYLNLSIESVIVAHLVIIDTSKPKGEKMSVGRIAPLIFCCQTNNAWQVILGADEV